MLDANHGPLPHSTWYEKSVEDYPTHEDLAYAIEPVQDYWIGIEITPNATQAFEQARANGDASWDPASVVNIIYATARSQTMVPGTILQPAAGLVQGVLRQLSRNLTSQFLTQNANNAQVLQTANRAPQTLADPLTIKQVDLRPWSNNVAFAPTFVGLIYLVILTFQVVMAEYGGLMVVGKFLHLRGLITLRILMPIVTAFFTSLMITLINIPFGLPFDAMFSYGAGFMVYWMATWCGIILFGLALQSVLTIVGPRFIGLFLVLFIISNVSVASTPIELMPSFYQYGYAMPFYNLRAIYLAVLFNVGYRTCSLLTPGNMILKYIGIVWAWIVSILLTLPFIFWFDHRRRQKQLNWQKPVDKAMES